MRQRRIDELREAIAKKAKELAATSTIPDGHPTTPTPGDLYILNPSEEFAIEWLVVRHHVDDPKTVLLAPTDDYFLLGSADLALPSDLVGGPCIVRCGEATWLSCDLLPSNSRVGTVPAEAVKLVRKYLAALVRGQVTTNDLRDDANPDYQEWMEEVANAREVLWRQNVPQSPLNVGDHVAGGIGRN